MFFLLVLIFGFFAFSCVSSQCFSWNLHFGLFAFFLIFLWETCHWICLRFSRRCLCHLSLVRALTWVTGEARLSTLSKGADCGTHAHCFLLTQHGLWDPGPLWYPYQKAGLACSAPTASLASAPLAMQRCSLTPSLSFGMDRKICRKVMDYVSFFSFLSFSHRVSFTLTDSLVPNCRTLR